jgi:hypothetical protein
MSPFNQDMKAVIYGDYEPIPIKLQRHHIDSKDVLVQNSVGAAPNVRSEGSSWRSGPSQQEVSSSHLHSPVQRSRPIVKRLAGVIQILVVSSFRVGRVLIRGRARNAGWRMDNDVDFVSTR